VLDVLASRVVYAARRFEMAVHDPGPWAMSWGDIVVPAKRMKTDSEIVFTANFPEDESVPRPAHGRFVLLCGDAVVGVREQDHPGDGPFSLCWSIEAHATAAA
jgi:hypothetical protein